MDALPPSQPQPTNTPVMSGGSTGKLRLMCSYGGHIIPRPQTKSLCYASGDTRIVTVSTVTSLTLSSLTTHLAATLNVHYPFTLKYQLPCQDLDSLISLSTDEDLQIMLEEHDRLSSSLPSSRIRLFLFLTKSPPALAEESRQQKAEDGDWFRGELEQPVLQHPKTESWFVDALRSAGIMQKCGLEGQIEGSVNGGGHESIFLDTSSSFGSSSSSVSLSNLPPIKAHGEDSVANLIDSKPKLPSPESVASDTSLATAISQADTSVYIDQIMSIPAMDSKIYTNPFETETTKLPDHPYGTQMNKPIPASGYTVSSLPDQLQPQQVQFVQSGSHYFPQNPPGLLPSSYYYPMYPPLPQQQPQFHFQPARPYQVYYLPVGQSQPYNFPVQCGLFDASNIVSGQASVHPNVSFGATPHVPLQEVTLMPELASQTFRTTQAANPLVHIPYNENGQQSFVPQQIHVQPQNISLAHREAVNYGIELKVDDDPERAQIYKSQPPPPMLPSQYQTMAKAPAVVLSETLAQLHMDNVQSQIKPQ